VVGAVLARSTRRGESLRSALSDAVSWGVGHLSERSYVCTGTLLLSPLSAGVDVRPRIERALRELAGVLMIDSRRPSRDITSPLLFAGGMSTWPHVDLPCPNSIVAAV